MPVTIVSPPEQAKPPTPLGQRVTVDVALLVSNGPIETIIDYEVQPHHAALGFSIGEGASRSEQLTNGSHTRRHRFLLQGPNGVLNVVDCLIRVRAAAAPRGFSVLVDNG